MFLIGNEICNFNFSFLTYQLQYFILLNFIGFENILYYTLNVIKPIKKPFYSYCTYWFSTNFIHDRF